jgi:hypothetical protein
MTPPPTSIDGTDITGATIDGTEVSEITIDGQTVFTVGPPPIPASVTHRYQFNEGSGGTAFDSEGSNDGNISNATFTTDSKEGSHALAFNQGNFVTINDVDLIDGDFGISAFIKTTDTSKGSILAENDSGVQSEYRLRYNNGDLELVTLDGNFLVTASLNDGVFHHVAVTRNGSTLEFYIDNNLVGTFSFTTTDSKSQTTRIGVNGSFTSSDEFVGTMDDLVIAVDGGFSANDVDALFQQQK